MKVCRQAFPCIIQHKSKIKTEKRNKMVTSMTINYNPIGIINTPFKSQEGMPIQPGGAKGIRGTVTMKRNLMEGLEDLDGFSHIYLIYHFHKSKSFTLKTHPFLDDKSRGVFSTRAPQRPNPIGISVVKLIRIEKNILEIENVDMLDGTPLIDIKPYVPDFDAQKADKVGWTAHKTGDINSVRSDDRFK